MEETMSTHNLTGVPRTMVINLRARADESARSDALFHDERAARHHIATHDNPLVVELGAGLSTRYYRVGQDRARWIELNLPEAINIRRQLDTESAEHTFIACSVLDFAWMEQLPHTPPESILFTAEGLLVYFEEAELK